MTALAIVLASVLALACVVFVARSFLRSPTSADDAELDEASLRLLALAEERDRLLAALSELEFDHRAGKVSDGDYREQVGPLRRELASVLAALDRETENGSPGSGAP